MSYQYVLLAQTLRSEEIHPGPSQLCDNTCDCSASVAISPWDAISLGASRSCPACLFRVLVQHQSCSHHGTPFLSVHLEVVQLVFFCALHLAVFFFGRAADACHFLDAVTHVALFPLPGGGVEPSLRRFLRHQLLGLSGHGHCWLLSSVFCGVCLRMGDRR